MSTNLSAAEENYIKHIYHLQQPTGFVNTNQLAASLQARPASITDMLKKLKQKKLLQYEPYKEFCLNTQGKKIALIIIRKHRLWEYFLVEKLQFGWDEVHEIAEELEHITSRKLIDSLDRFLGYPRFDPHGDPIPDINGKLSALDQKNILYAEPNTALIVSSVGSQSSELLEVLKHKNIQIGTKLEIKRKFSFDNSLEIKIRNHPAVTISEQLAKVLFVSLAVPENKEIK